MTDQPEGRTAERKPTKSLPLYIIGGLIIVICGVLVGGLFVINRLGLFPSPPQALIPTAPSSQSSSITAQPSLTPYVAPPETICTVPYEAELQALESQLASNPDDTEALLERTLIFIKLRRTDEALTDLNRALALDQNNVIALLRRSQVYRQQNNMDASLQDIERALSLDPQNPSVYIERGNWYRGSGNLSYADADYRYAIQLDPNNAGGYISLGILAGDQEQYERAKENYLRGIELDPYNAAAYSNLVGIYRQLGDFEAAFQAASHAIELEPASAVAYFNRGQIYYHNMAEFERAVQDYSCAILIRPDYELALLNRANVNIDYLEEYELALEDLNHLEELDPDTDELTAQLYANRGWAYYHLGQYDAAIADFDILLTTYPYFDVGYYRRGIVYFDLNDLPAARSNFDSMLAINPEHTGTYLWRAWVSFREGKPVDEVLADMQSFFDASCCQETLYDEMVDYSLEHPEDRWPYFVDVLRYDRDGNVEQLRSAVERFFAAGGEDDHYTQYVRERAQAAGIELP